MNSFIKSKLILAGIVLFTITAKSQVTLNFESGNKNVEIGNCWSFKNVDYDKSTNFLIHGKWSGKNTKISASAEDTWIKSPWVKLASGNITFNMKSDIIRNDERRFVVYAIPNDKTKPNQEGTPEIVFTSQALVSNANNTIIPCTAPIASKYVGGLYKIRLSFTGQSSGAKTSEDDISIPGEYFSDPANNGLPKVEILDTDKDGVADADDQYPNDPNRSFKVVFPGNGVSSTGYGTLAFEDNWPIKSDYDFNDVVVDYNISTVTNAKNNVVEATCSFILKASGADFNNGFGFQLDNITPDKIALVENSYKIENSKFNYTELNNKLEANQTYATCVVFDDFYKIMKNADGSKIINTLLDKPKVTAQTITVKLTFNTNAVSINNFSIDNFNFFIIPNLKASSDGKRVEIHLPNRIPTSKANMSSFGSLDDKSNKSTIWYKTANNLPWGINIIQGLNHPIEAASLSDAYPNILRWAESGGTLYTDWFADKPGYRVTEKIYNK